MCGSLVMGMVPGMFDRLGLDQSTDGKDTDNREDGDEFENYVFHRNTTQCNVTRLHANRPPSGLSSQLLEGGSLKKAED